ncbi:SGNH/GDSL hydrolase family protein [Parvularcula oceani]|uniref:SGNH/GDSL hydrolase family protein n=1 Tax=Parvularcula oceani TaxID=1247963 RepID=UPI00068FDCE9|nr:SGNH/GDSL hydrolase family protein [Parvularcula oceani]
MQIARERWRSRASVVGTALCGLAGLYFAAIAAYALVNYSAFGASQWHLARYILGPLAIAGTLLFIALRSAPATRLIVAGNLWAVLIALFAYEAIVNVQINRTLNGSLALHREIQAEIPSVRESLPPGMTLRRLNADLGGRTLAGNLLAGIPDKDVLLCIHPEEGPLVYRADRYGFNNPDDLHDRGALDMVLVGDSFVEGICLPPGQDVAGVLRERGVRAASIGMRGNGPLLELAALRRFGPVMRPRRVVLVFYSGNDWSNLEEEAEIGWLRAALDPEAEIGPALLPPGQAAAAQKAAGEAWSSRYEPEINSRVLNRARSIFALSQTATLLGLHYPALEPPQPVIEDVLAAMAATARSWGGELTIVYLPRDGRFRGLLPNDFAFEEDRQRILRPASRLGIPVIDLASAFVAEGRPARFYGPDGHLSPEGARLLAGLLGEPRPVRMASGGSR